MSTTITVMDEVNEFDSYGDEASKTRHFPYLSTDAKLVVLYRRQVAFENYVRTMEEKASAMADPENLLKMAEKFMGGGFM